MNLKRCDNELCRRDMVDGAEIYTVSVEVPMPTIGQDTSDRHFCSPECIAYYYTEGQT